MKNRIDPRSAFGSAFKTAELPKRHRIAELEREKAMKQLKEANGQLVAVTPGRGTIQGITRDASEVARRHRAACGSREGW